MESAQEAMPAPQAQGHQGPVKDHEIKYFVNGEEENTSKSSLTVKEILENAGFTPATDYTLASESPPKDFDSHYDEPVKIHPNERFQAKFKGPTPTS